MEPDELVSASYAIPTHSTGLLREVIVQEHGRAVVQQFVDNRDVDLTSKTEGVSSFLRSWAAGDVTYDQTWDVVIGGAMALQEGQDRVAPEVVAAELALHLSLHGHDGEWAANLPACTRLRFGRILLPAIDRIEVVSAAGEIAVNVVTAGRRHALSLGPADDYAAGIDALPQLCTGRSPWIVLPAEALRTTALSELAGKVERLGGSLFLSRVHRALMLLNKYAANYLEWVDNSVRYLVPLSTISCDVFESGSHRWCPSLVYLTNFDSPVQIAEALVHESSHQYFYIINRYIALYDPNDESLYYSVVKGEGRPLIFILLAYHAFANVCLFFSQLRNDGFVTSADFFIYELHLRAQVFALRVQLKKCGSLTSNGIAFCDGIADALEKAISPSPSPKVQLGDSL